MELTQQLLAFSRKRILHLRVLDLNNIVSDIAQILQRVLGKDRKLVTALASNLNPILADSGQIEQILMNLATNGRDAMPFGGTVTIQTENDTLGPDDLVCHPDVTPGRYVRLSVSDTGVGMSEEVCSRVFEPFFTTKPRAVAPGSVWPRHTAWLSRAAVIFGFRAHQGAARPSTFTFQAQATRIALSCRPGSRINRSLHQMCKFIGVCQAPKTPPVSVGTRQILAMIDQALRESPVSLEERFEPRQKVFVAFPSSSSPEFLLSTLK